jgi:hypothetical protein
MLDQWNMGLGRSAAERRIALRLSRERATLTGELTTADDTDAKAFIAAQQASVSEAARSAQPPAASARADDDLDALDVDDGSDDLDDDQYYADAFADVW